MPRPIAHLLTVVIAALTLAGTTASAQDRHNAAGWYERAFALAERLTEEQWLLIIEYQPDAHGVVSDELRAALQRIQPMLRDYRRASLKPYSDFGLAREEGFDILLPHLAKMRQVARAAHVDALVRLHDGDARGAAENIAALYRSVNHYGDDGILISALVGRAVFALADAAAQYGMDQAAFSAAEAHLLMRSLEALDPADPFGFIEAAFGEHELVLSTITRELTESGNLENLQRLLLDDAEDNPFDGMTEEDIQHEMVHYDRFMDEVLDILSLGDSEEARVRMGELEQAVRDGEYGVLVTLFSPAWSHLLRLRDDAESQLAERLDSLSELAAGAADPMEMTNAAMYYLRAISLIESLDPDARRELHEVDLLPGASLSETVVELLVEAASAIQLLQEGSLKRRCNFAMAVHGTRPTGDARLPHVPTYAAGMREAMRLLLVDVIRRGQLDEFDDAGIRLESTLRIIAHLAEDGHLPSSRISHRALLDSLQLVEPLLQHDRLSADRAAALVASFDRIGRADPFGYRRAMHLARRELLGTLDLGGWFGQGHIDRPMRSIVMMADGDELWQMIMLRDLARRVARGEPIAPAETIGEIEPISPDGRVSQQRTQSRPVDWRLRDIINDEAHAEMRHFLIALAQQLGPGASVNSFEQWRVHRPLAVEEHMTRARADLRVAGLFMRPPPPLAERTQPVATGGAPTGQSSDDEVDGPHE